MNYIKVSDGKFSVKLPVKQKRISMQTIQAYFPNISGLTYEKNMEKFGVEVSNNEFSLVDGISEYAIHYAKCFKETLNDQSSPKRRRIKDIMELIEGGKNENSSHPLQNNHIMHRKSKKFLYIGWKHRSNSTRRDYQQMKDPFGGIKKIELDKNVDYTYEVIFQQSIGAMKNSLNEATLDNCIIQLANNYDEVIDEFTNTSGKKCTFWEFSSKIRTKSSQLRLNLLTREREAINIIDKSKSEIKVLKERIENQKSPSIVSTLSSNKSYFRLSNRHNSASLVIQSKVKQSELNKPRTSETITSKNEYRGPDLNKKSLSSTENKEGPITISAPIINLDELEFSDNVLGKGAFGSVILCKWKRNGSEVAVKKIPIFQNEKYTIRELNALDRVRHPNIVSLMAVSNSDENLYIVMEYFQGSNLRSFFMNRSVKVPYEDKINRNYYICLQICRGISYLHECDPTIIHKDIKPENILVNKHLSIKICDLGLSKICDISSSSPLNTTVGNNFHGTPMYMAPEILLNNLPGGTHSDVWSMACCFVELFSEKSIWDVKPHFSLPNLRQLVSTQIKPNLGEIPIILQGRLSECFEHEPSKRPKALILLQIFDSLWNKMQY